MFSRPACLLFDLRFAAAGSTFGMLLSLGRVALLPLRSAEPVDPPPRSWVSRLPLAAPAVLPGASGVFEGFPPVAGLLAAPGF